MTPEHSTTPIKTGNRILDALPHEEMHRLLKEAVLVSRAVTMEIGRFGSPIRDLYFPVSCVFSVLVQLESGDRVEAATIGNEGFCSPAVFAGVLEMPHAIVVQVPGDSYRVPVLSIPRDLLRAGSMLYTTAMKYMIYQMQVGNQTAACNALHSLEQRTTRWLLAMDERAPTKIIPLTQEFLAHVLGVSRQAMTAVTRRLEDIGAVRHSRGKLEILNRKRLAAASCECHREVERFYKRVFG